VIGQWLTGGLWLLEIPDYMIENDFPYPKRPHPREVPFADRLSVVRILGGWDYTDGCGEPHSEKEADLVFRNAEGELEYRWHLLQHSLPQ